MQLDLKGVNVDEGQTIDDPAFLQDVMKQRMEVEEVDDANALQVMRLDAQSRCLHLTRVSVQAALQACMVLAVLFWVFIAFGHNS